MVLTVFRSRVKSDLQPEQLQEYLQMLGRMSVLAKTMPGYISHRGYGAEDGERVVIVEFESEQAQEAFAYHPQHLEAMKLGRKSIYLEYSVQVCSVQRESIHPSK
jgi:heme-degrading monooxygenase HmoA